MHLRSYLTQIGMRLRKMYAIFARKNTFFRKSQKSKHVPCDRGFEYKTLNLKLNMHYKAFYLLVHAALDVCQVVNMHILKN